MKRSEINQLIRSAEVCFKAHGWALPPNPKWDVTDFGLGAWRDCGLVLVNLAEEPEYCEKLMYARKSMLTPVHCHLKKKEDIICRWGTLAVRVWPGRPDSTPRKTMKLPINHERVDVQSGEVIEVPAGSRVTMLPGVYHEFYPLTEECILGEVSTANDDEGDNYFVSPEIGRYPGIEEDERPYVRLLSDK
jgi:D-lyxose ketol-isomerase